MLCHYLPQFYLQQFTADDRLYVFDRKTAKLRRDSPRNVAAITDYYVLSDASGKREERVETKFLSTVESASAPALSRLANCEAISDAEHDVVATFLAILCARIPAFEETYAALNNHLGQEYLRALAGTPEGAAQFLASRGITRYSPAQFSAFVNSDALTFPPAKHQRLRLMMQSAEPLISGFKSMDWWLWRASGVCRFVTSDAPFGLIPLEGAPPAYGELSSGVLKFIALSPDVCLMLADRQRDDPFLTVKDLDDDGVRAANAAIALEATRLIVARDRDLLEAVLDETGLRTSTFMPRTIVVNWVDSVEQRSFAISVRLHHDTGFPLTLPLEWQCRHCKVVTVESFVIAEDLEPANNTSYTQWLDRRCSSCGRSPRRTKSTLSGEPAVHLPL